MSLYNVVKFYRRRLTRCGLVTVFLLIALVYIFYKNSTPVPPSTEPKEVGALITSLDNDTTDTGQQYFIKEQKLDEAVGVVQRDSDGSPRTCPRLTPAVTDIDTLKVYPTLEFDVSLHTLFKSNTLVF